MEQNPQPPTISLNKQERIVIVEALHLLGALGWVAGTAAPLICRNLTERVEALAALEGSER